MERCVSKRIRISPGPACGECAVFNATGKEETGGLGLEGICGTRRILAFESWNPLITLRTSKIWETAEAIEKGKAASCFREPVNPNAPSIVVYEAPPVPVAV
jgi:hypothetical protein